MKTSTIKASKQTRTFEGKKGGTYYVHAIELDNGDKGECNTKTPDAAFLDVGATLTYTIEPNGTFANKITRITDDKGGGYKGGGFSKEPFEERAVASAYNQTAVLFSHKAVEESKMFTIDQYIAAANKVYDAMLATAKRGKL